MLKVYMLCEDVDLGCHVHNVSADEKRMNELAASNNERDRKTWTGADGIERKSADKWWVDTRDLEDYKQGV